MPVPTLALLSIVTALCGPALPQEIPLAKFVVAPPLGEPVKTTALEGKEWVQDTPGVHEGHRILTISGVLCPQGQPAYGVNYQACLEKDKHSEAVDLIAKEGFSGLGLSKPTGSNWYGGGCLDVLVNGEGLGPYRPAIRRLEFKNGAVAVEAVWQVPWGRVTLRFVQLPGEDKCFVRGELDCPNVQSLALRLRCYPAGFIKGRSRVAQTQSARQDGPGHLLLHPFDSWVWYGDTEHDRARDPKSSGCCALMFPRTEVHGGSVRVGNYSTDTALNLRPNLQVFHLLLWEFPQMANAEAVAYMQKLSEQHRVTLGELATAQVKTEGVPPRTIVLDGEPAASIRLDEKPTDRECQAALEIQEYVRKASGAVLPIVMGSERPAGHVIRLHQQPAPGTSGESFVLTVADRETELTGRSPLAVLYAAYDLLERGLGVRWYLPGPLGEVVPKAKTITLPALKLEAAPSFPMRWIGRGEWMLRNKQNSCPDGFYIYPGIYHTQNRLLPHKKYFPQHPEYFALIKGRRSRNGQCKLCYSNPDVAREVARNMAKALDENPNIDLLSLSPTDGQLWCECEACKAMDEPGVPKDQSKSRRSLLFYNAVAAELRKTHPEAKILVGAYNVYNWPPRDPAIKADPMLSVIITHYEDYCMAHPVADPTCPRNKRYVELIEAWEKLGCRVYYYEYYWKVNWMDLPWPIVHCLKEDLPWYHQRGHQGVYTQYTRDNIWTLFPAHYVAARLLWDVSTDVDATVSKMYDDLFGAAGPAMKQYYGLMEHQMATCGQHFPGHGSTAGLYVFTPEVRRQLRRHYEEAVKANRDPVVAQRLERIGVSLEYVERLMKYVELRQAIAQADDALAATRAAREQLQQLSDEVLKDRSKWGGIVSTSIFRGRGYMGRELEQLKRSEAKLRAAAVKPIVRLPTKWKFALDRDDVGQKQRWFAPDFDDREWKDIEIARTWEEQGYEYDGLAWYRLRWQFDPEWLKQAPLALHFRAVDGEGWVYWNGKLIGHHEGWDEPFSVALPADDIRTKEPNVIAVRVYDGSNQGGIWKPVELVKAE